MNEELIEYLKSIVDIKYENNNDYLHIEFKISFNDKLYDMKLYVGNNNIKMYFMLDCPICNQDIFIIMNEFNLKSDLFKAFHNNEYVVIEAFTYYNNSLITVKDMLDELLTDDYALINNLIDTIFEVNSVDKIKVFEKLIDNLGED
jgi:hypothetical protein